MPMHDWTKVEADVYHDFHTSWIVACARGINKRLPKGYYAMKEKSLGMLIADVIAMRNVEETPVDFSSTPGGTLTKPFTFQATDTVSYYPGFRQKRIAIRHELLERVVAIVELVSPGNKSGDDKFRRFRNKIASSIRSGIHAVVIDPFPPTPRDPDGIHAAIWKKLKGRKPKPSEGHPLTNVSYEAAFEEEIDFKCYSRPGAVGEPCPELPLFLQPGVGVAIDFEEIYNDAYADVIPRFRAMLEA